MIKYRKIHNFYSSNRKRGYKIIKNISYILQFIDTARFMASTLSSLVNNLSEELHRIKSKLEHDDKKFQTCGIKCKYCDCFLEYKSFKDDLIEYKCLSCNKSFFNTYKFSNHDKNKFVLLLRVKHYYLKIKTFKVIHYC